MTRQERLAISLSFNLLLAFCFWYCFLSTVLLKRSFNQKLWYSRTGTLWQKGKVHFRFRSFLVQCPRSRNIVANPWILQHDRLLKALTLRRIYLPPDRQDLRRENGKVTTVGMLLTCDVLVGVSLQGWQLLLCIVALAFSLNICCALCAAISNIHIRNAKSQSQSHWCSRQGGITWSCDVQNDKTKCSIFSRYINGELF